MISVGSDLERFRDAYGRHRAAEGRGAGGTDELLALPYIREGPHAAAWQIRARTFEGFVRHIVRPLAHRLGRPLRIADLGAGNGWLSYRMARLGHHAVAVDLRTDTVDGLGAAAPYGEFLPRMMPRVAASFDALPLAAHSFDLVAYNASLHYALDLRGILTEAARILDVSGCIAVLDSPFYARESDGAAMMEEKRRTASARFGRDADALMTLPFIEFLTAERLAQGSAGLDLQWRRRRVSYPLHYELRPVRALLRRQRRPSRFDIWHTVWA